MTRLIDADKIEYTSIAHLASYPVAPSPCDTVMRAEINAMPTVDAEPVVETSIIIREMDSFNELRCSKCGKAWLWSGDLFIFNYCPNCGAKVTDRHYISERKEE